MELSLGLIRQDFLLLYGSGKSNILPAVHKLFWSFYNCAGYFVFKLNVI